MMIELVILKSGERVFAYAFGVRDKSEVPEQLKKAISAFYETEPSLSLLDPEVILKLEAPLNGDMPVYG